MKHLKKEENSKSKSDYLETIISNTGCFINTGTLCNMFIIFIIYYCVVVLHPNIQCIFSRVITHPSRKC